MKKYYYLIIVIFIVIVSCKIDNSLYDRYLKGLSVANSIFSFKINEQKEQEENSCDSITFPEYIPADTKHKIMPVAKGWLRYYGLDMNKFVLSGCTYFKADGRYSYPMDSIDIDMNKDPKRFVYSYAPNRRRFIDIYFYASYDEEKKAVFFDGEIDQLVWLYDLEKKMGYVVESWGAIGRADDVVWIDNNRFVVFNNNSDGLFLIEIFDIEKQITVSYYLEKEKEPYGGYYQKRARQKGIKEYL